MPDWRSIAMVLITTTIGGALDAALASSSSSSSNSSVEEILGSELCDILRDTLVSGLRSFTCKAKDHDGVVLSIACASAYLQFPEFSKNGCGNAKKKAYADVLNFVLGCHDASNEELVFSNSSTKKTEDDISSPTLADEAGDRRLRIKDAVVIAINSDKSNGTLAGQLISSLIKKALFTNPPPTPIDANVLWNFVSQLSSRTRRTRTASDKDHFERTLLANSLN